MKKKVSSKLSGFHKLSVLERQEKVKQFTSDGTITAFLTGGLTDDQCDTFIENAIGKIALPLGVATNFLINDKEYLIPMAVEEPSVIAAASNAAKMVRQSGGFIAKPPLSYTVAQIELLHAKKLGAFESIGDTLIQVANDTQPVLIELGGGVIDIQLRKSVGAPHRHVVHLVVNCLDAMGANMVNTMAEAIAPIIQTHCDCEVGLKILSNLANERVVTCTCNIHLDHLHRKQFSGEEVAKGVVSASEFASADPFRAATHNKGIFNGIDPVLIATGNDWRAVEAGGHAYASLSGQYSPLATWHMNEHQLIGKLELPMAIGIIGGASKAHPAAAKALEIMNIQSAGELAMVAGSVGLASNLAALSALATEGIQAGHMRLHNKRIPK